MFPRRRERRLGLLALLMAIGGGVVVRGGEPSVENSLAKLGLKQAGTILVLEAESEVHTKADEIRKLARELSNTVVRQRSTLSEKERQAAIQELNAEISQFRSEMNAATQGINQVPKYRGRVVSNYAMEQISELNMYKSQLQWEVNQMTTFLNQLKNQPFDPKARQKLDVEVLEKRDALHQAAQELRGLVDTTHEKYGELAKDSTFKAVVASLKEKTGKTLGLGPSRQFHTDVKMLERLEASTGDGDSSTKGGRASHGRSKKKRTSAAAKDSF